MREKWMIILRAAKAQGGLFVKSEATEWIKHFYYAGADNYAQQILCRMVKDGCISRIKKGHYQVKRSPKPMKGGAKSNQVFTNPQQGNLFT
jgi:predicted transcriptional regulator of viral defense system